jgi:hypothetical protein
MKLIVETTGDFQIRSAMDEQYARHDRPSVVRKSSFINQHAIAGRLVTLGQVNDEATDEELVKYLESAKGDRELALASFIEAFPVNPAAETEAAKAEAKPRQTRKAAK